MGTGGVRYDERTDSELVLAVRGHGSNADSPDPDAFGLLFDRWYDRCWNVARNIMRSDDLAAEVAQDAMLAGWQRLEQLQNPDAFGGWLLRITRNRALTRLEREGRSRATGDEIVSAMRDRNIAHSHDEPLGAQAPPSVEAAMEVHDRQELVWAAAAALGDRDASLLDLHLRHGLSPAEIAEELGVEANAAHQQLFRLRNKLGDAIGSYLLWRNGRLLCRGLAAAVSGDVAFDRSVAKAVAKHQKTCDECAERRAGMVSPTKLFASVPFLVVPFQFKVDAAAALAEAGVPIDPSAISTAGSPPGGPSASSSGQSSGPSTGQSSGPSSGQSSGPSTGSGNAPTVHGSTPAPAPIQAPTPAPAILGHGDPAAYPGPSPATAPDFGGPAGVARNIAWTATRSAWLKSLGGAIGVALVGLLLIAALPGVALSDLWPFGDETTSIGSETVAGPSVDEAPTTETTPTNEESSLSESTSGSADSSAGVSGLADPASTNTTIDSGSRGGSTTNATAASTTGSTAGSSSSTDTTATTETTSSTDTTGTTDTTTDTSRTTSTDRDTTSSSTTETTTETTEVDPPPDPPQIVRFTTRTDANIRCGRNNRPYEAVWATENTDSVELFLPNGSSVSGKPNGIQPFCGQPGDSISLLATGPGGNDKASTTLN